MLKGLRPCKELFATLIAMFKKVWDHRAAASAAIVQAWRGELVELDRQKQKLIDRMIEVDQPAVVKAIGDRMNELEKKRLVTEERIETAGQPPGDFEKSVRTACRFLASPWEIWRSGSFEHKRVVLKLALADHLTWVRNEGFRTANLSWPFKLLEQLSGGFAVPDWQMVRADGIEPPTFAL